MACHSSEIQHFNPLSVSLTTAVMMMLQSTNRKTIKTIFPGQILLMNKMSIALENVSHLHLIICV